MSNSIQAVYKNIIDGNTGVILKLFEEFNY
jgi:hypothetical protein